MTIPTVSIVVASYNYGRFLRQALDSLVAQTVSDWEAIIVDDGSTDDSLAIAEAYCGRDRRFRLIRQQHGGQPRTKNAGIAAATGEFIAFLDADDAWLPDKLAKQLELMRARPEIGASGTGRWHMTESGEVTRAFPMTRTQFDVDDCFRENPICFSSAIVRRIVFEHLGGFDESVGIAIDFDLWLRVARHYRIECLAEPLVLYRDGHANLSRRVLERLRIAELLMRRFRQHYDRPHRLRERSAREATARTLAHRGLVERVLQPRLALPTLGAAVAYAPACLAVWKALVSTLVPTTLRAVVRRVRGGRDWEAGYRHPSNRPEPLV